LIDVVVIATPDPWHAIQTIAACRAGEDVCIEKPLSMTVVEGRRMIEVARQTKRVVQVGIHRRCTPLHAEGDLDWFLQEPRDNVNDRGTVEIRAPV